MGEFKDVFTSKSGEIFSSFLDAKEEDAKIELLEWLDKPKYLGQSLYEAILLHRHELAKILNNLVKYAK